MCFNNIQRLNFRQNYRSISKYIAFSNFHTSMKCKSYCEQSINKTMTIHCEQLRQFHSNLTFKNGGKIQTQFRQLSKISNFIAVTDELDNKLSILASKSINVNSFTYRTHNCNELQLLDVGKKAILCGWLDFHRVGKFLILRDGYGRTQIFIPEDKRELQEMVEKLPLESVIQVEGLVRARPPGTEQPSMSTGKIELLLEKLTILNYSSPSLPFAPREYNKPKEYTRLQHRYLDLRYAEMQRNLRFRSKFLMDLRDFLVNQAGFVDVETPTLFRPTPGGAQEFIVPTRTPGLCYSLVQSPQQFKQILMSGSIDRYFQIARCYRDEGSRGDRQPEFTQLDLELSFTSSQDIMNLVEQMLFHSWPKNLPKLNIPFTKLKYWDALETYGSDKPDFTIPIKLLNCTEIFTNEPNLKIDKTDFDARILIFPKPFTDLTNSLKNKFSGQLAKAHPQVRLLQEKFKSPREIEEWVLRSEKFLGVNVGKELVKKFELKEECVVFLAFGRKLDVCTLLGKIRLAFSQYLEERGLKIRKIDQNIPKYNFTWIVDFPLFELDENNSLAPIHHPFTAPNPEDTHFLATEPLKVRSLAYDLVLNGQEIAGGSMRIHEEEEQIKILKLLKIPQGELEHLLSALRYGCPPHGGIALGMDRFFSMILNTSSIRDVIAFPKTLEGKDPLSGAPVEVSEKDKSVYHLGGA